MQYHDQPLQFISNHYFQVKSEEDEKYKTILGMMKALTYLPSTLMPLISFLIIAYVYPLISCYVKQYSDKLEKGQFFYIKQLTDTEIQLIQENFTQKWKGFHLICLLLTSTVINILLVILHISSAVKFIDYGKEILHTEEFLIGPSGNHYLPYMHAALSYFLVTAMFIIAIGYCFYKHAINSLIATSISVNIIYASCYFSPTMLLAFFHDPLLTIFNCFMIIGFIGLNYTLISTVLTVGLMFLSKKINKLIPKAHISLKVLIYSIIVYTTGYSVCYLLILIVGMISLGSFSDFEALQNDMILPIVVGLLTLFVVKPAHKYAKIKLSEIVVEKEKDTVSNNQVGEVHIMMEESHDTQCEEIDSQNDENTIV